MSLKVYSKKFCCKGKEKKKALYIKTESRIWRFLFCFVSVCFKMREKAADLTTDVKDHTHD